MSKWRVTVPSTMEQGLYSTIVDDESMYESKEQQALLDYNHGRSHDGLRPLKRMPNGTRYRRIE